MATTASLTRCFVTALRDRLGWDYEVLDEGDVAFEVGGRTFLIENDAERDPEFLHVMLVVKCTSPIAPEILDSIELKALKVALRGDVLVFGFSSFVAPRDTLPAVDLVAGVLPRAVSIIETALREVAEKRELAGILAATDAQDDAA